MAREDLVWGSQGAWGIFIAFTAVAVWSSIPLTLRLLVTFKRFRGLYFWSILVTTWGLTVRALAQMLHWLIPSTHWLVVQLMAQSGWMCMVTGFPLVLYSRLNLILETRRWVLVMIIVNSIILEPMMATLAIGNAYLDEKKDAVNKERWNRVFRPAERVTIVLLVGQETLIAFIYILAAYKYLKARSTTTRRSSTTTKEMALLIFVQIVVMTIDLGIVIIDFLGYNVLKLFLNSFVYACKLELEFIVLNQLVEMSKLGVPGMLSASRGIPEDVTPNGSPLESPDPDAIAKSDLLKFDSTPGLEVVTLEKTPTVG